MKRPIILEGKPFDWDEGKRYGAQAVDDDGNVNWMAAMFADPGVMACPGCGEHLWNEGMTAKCPDCEHEWRTPNGVHVDARKKPKTDLPALIAEVRRLDATLPRSVVLPQTVGHIEGLQALRTAAPLLAAECERLRDILAAVAAPLSIDGENHAATVMHARAALESMPLKRKGRT